MHEQFDSRLWAEHGPQITASIADALRKAGDAFRKLQEIEFDAPWRRRDNGANTPCANC